MIWASPKLTRLLVNAETSPSVCLNRGLLLTTFLQIRSMYAAKLLPVRSNILASIYLVLLDEFSLFVLGFFYDPLLLWICLLSTRLFLELH